MTTFSGISKLYSWAKKASLGLLIWGSSSLLAQAQPTVFWQEDFTTPQPGWVLNTDPGLINGSAPTGGNTWIINDRYYTGGGGGLGCFIARASPSRASGPMGGAYLHIHDSQGSIDALCPDAAGGAFFNASGANRRAAVSPVINTQGRSNVTFKFYAAVNGAASAYGMVDFSTDGGTTWNVAPMRDQNNQLVTQFNNRNTWRLYTSTPASDIYANRANLRFRFVWVNGGAGTDPPFMVDNISLESSRGLTLVSANGTTGTTYCPGETPDIRFSTSPTFSANTIITAQMSASADFANVAATASFNLGGTPAQTGNFGLQVPCNAPAGNYFIRLISSEGDTSRPALPVTVRAVTPSNLTLNVDTICAGTSYTYNAIWAGTCGDPEYRWFVNGSRQSNATSSFVYTPTAGDIIRVDVRKRGFCDDPDSVSTATVIPVVLPLVTPTLALANLSSSTLCAGQIANLRARVAGLSTGITYRWYVDNVLQIGQADSAFNFNPSTDGDFVVRAEIIGAGRCVSTTPVTQTINISRTSQVVPTVALTNTSGETLCQGASVNFTTNSAGGGDNPIFRWYVNGTVVGGQTGATYTYVPNNGDSIRVELLSSSPCRTIDVVSSTSYIANVLTTAPPTLTLQAPTTVCNNGAPITIGSTASEAGTRRWFVDGVLITSATGNDYTFTPVAGASSVTIRSVIVTTRSCATPDSASAETTINLSPAVNPTISLVQGSTPACPGATVTMVSTATNTGNATYQWWVNGTAVSGTGANLVGVFAAGDVIKVKVTTTESCFIRVADSSEVTVAGFGGVVLATCAVPSDIRIGETKTYSASASGSGEISYIFNFGNGQSRSSTTGSVEYAYPEKGVFTYQVIALDNNGCRDTCSQSVEVKGARVIPNVITPNNDNVNDEFEVQPISLDNFKLNIYNRYGTQVFSTEDPSKRFKAEGLPAGEYFYNISMDGQVVKGWVTVLK